MTGASGTDEGVHVVAEFELLAAIRHYLDGDGPGLPRGVDDDAAVIATPGHIVAAVDALVDGVHVDRRWSTTTDMGFKALSVNVSDLAAMGATPTVALVALLRPSDLPLEEIEQLYAGLREAADRWGCRLIGGDTVTAPTLAVSVTALGQLVDERRVLRRDGAQPGDLVGVIGGLGLAAAGLELLRAEAHELLAAHPELAEAHRRPVALVEAAAPLVLAGASAAIDVSDGLGRDLGHIAEASGVGMRLDAERLAATAGVAAAVEHLGIEALELVVGGGEDQALAFTLPPRRLGRLDAALDSVGLRAQMVGEVVEGTGVEVDGRAVELLGWEHS
jgi:thiamine-monophosphate kinase